jgi:hypothetical protein
MVRSGSSFKSKVVQSNLCDENIKRNNEPMNNLFLEFSVMSEKWYYIAGWG